MYKKRKNEKKEWRKEGRKGRIGRKEEDRMRERFDGGENIECGGRKD